MSCWFLLDVAFYGVNLNQSVILMEIGFSKGSNEYDVLRKNAIGNLIIAVAGYVPGYFVTIFVIEKLGRRWIQIQGFLVVALMFAIIAGDYKHLGTGGKFVFLSVCHLNPFLPIFSLGPPPLFFFFFFKESIPQPLTPTKQFFFNFGPNATTFIIPAEVFPTRVRAFGHGTSAAFGKMGAILSALLFNYLSGPTVIGLSNVLWIFAACNLLGAAITWGMVPETKWRDADVKDYEEWFEANVRERGG